MSDKKDDGEAYFFSAAHRGMGDAMRDYCYRLAGAMIEARKK